MSLIFLSLTWCFLSEILKQDRFRSYSGTCQLLLFGLMRCWGEIKSLRAQSVGEVNAYNLQDMWK